MKTFDIGKLAEKAMHMDDRTWELHTNPWSGWSRVSVLPLLALAVWSREWVDYWSLALIATVVFWAYINPRLFPEPKSLDNWMSRAVLGERVWLTRKEKLISKRHADAILYLNIASGVGVVLLGIGLWQLDLGLTVAGLVTSIGAKLWSLDRMVSLKLEVDAEEGT